MIAVDPRLDRRVALQSHWSGHGIEVVSTSWMRERHPERSEGVTAYAAIEMMRSGAYEKRRMGERLLADPSVLMLYNPGETYEVRHPVGRRNEGTTIRIDPGALERVPGLRDGASSPHRPFVRPAVPCPATLAFALQHWLARFAVGAADDPLAVEERALALVHAALHLGRADSPRASATSEAARRRVLDAQAFLNESFSRRLLLADVAAASGCSVWHLSKEFRRVAGSPVHVLLRRLRIRHALDALRAGADDLTALALELGFCSHSHFTSAFRAEFGLAPRDARDALQRAHRPARHRRPGPHQSAGS